MGRGANRNEKCSCGSGIKKKKCKCKQSRLDKMFPNKVLRGETPEGEQFSFHVQSFVSHDDYPDINAGESEKWWYAPLCNQEQINRIFCPENAYDILLKKQVDSVIDNMRVNRTMLHKYHRAVQWNIEDCFKNVLFEVFFNAIEDSDDYPKCKTIPYGTTYDSDPNGQCIKTEYGNIITIASTLNEFLYFMNLFYLGIHMKNISANIALSAQRIAIRIMLKSETMDFEMDPRGDVPDDIDSQTRGCVNWQVLFVIAHEFSHSLLGHLDDNNVIKCASESDKTNIIYNQSQNEEFEADIYAIKLLANLYEIEDIAFAAIMFFLFLDIYEQAKEQISPSVGGIKTHPPAIARIENINNNFKEYLEKERIDNLINLNDTIKLALQEDIACNFDRYESYGSVYLGEWHKKILKDRVDY